MQSRRPRAQASPTAVCIKRKKKNVSYFLESSRSQAFYFTTAVIHGGGRATLFCCILCVLRIFSFFFQTTRTWSQHQKYEYSFDPSHPSETALWELPSENVVEVRWQLHSTSVLNLICNLSGWAKSIAIYAVVRSLNLQYMAPIKKNGFLSTYVRTFFLRTRVADALTWQYYKMHLGISLLVSYWGWLPALYAGCSPRV